MSTRSRSSLSRPRVRQPSNEASRDRRPAGDPLRFVVDEIASSAAAAARSRRTRRFSGRSGSMRAVMQWNVFQAGVLRVPDPVLAPRSASMTKLQARQLPALRVRRERGEPVAVGIGEPQLRAPACGRSARTMARIPGWPVGQVLQPGQFGGPTPLPLVPAGVIGRCPRRLRDLLQSCDRVWRRRSTWHRTWWTARSSTPERSVSIRHPTSTPPRATSGHGQARAPSPSVATASPSSFNLAFNLPARV